MVMDMIHRRYWYQTSDFLVTFKNCGYFGRKVTNSQIYRTFFVVSSRTRSTNINLDLSLSTCTYVWMSCVSVHVRSATTESCWGFWTPVPPGLVIQWLHGFLVIFTTFSTIVYSQFSNPNNWLKILIRIVQEISVLVFYFTENNMRRNHNFDQ